MARLWETDRTPESKKQSGQLTEQLSAAASERFDLTQQGKPAKTVIGVVLLVALALALSRMHPVPHEISDPSANLGQTTTGHAR